MLLEALRDYLLAQTGVTNLVSSRIVPGVLPQNSPVPAIDMRTVSGDHDHDLAGLTGIVKAGVTFDCYADDPEVADQVAEAAMYSGLIGYRGTQGGIFINAVRLDDGPTQSLEGVDPGSDQYRYVTSFTVLVTFSRSCR